MDIYPVQSVRSSGVNSIVSDLDGYSFPSHREFSFSMGSTYNASEHDEFGFDPPEQKAAYPLKVETYSPPQDHSDSSALGPWPGFEHEDKVGVAPRATTYEMDKFMNQNLPNTTAALSRYGQVTPPRSNSATSSVDRTNHAGDASPKTPLPERRKRSKVQKELEAQLPMAATSVRKRKNSRKAAANATQDPVEDDKRRQSLEKNRVAAAKCRINKKEKTEQLQRDSHDKAVHNAFLKEQVMRMKEEVQQMNAILLAHANCGGCKSPEEIRKHLANLGNDFFAQHMPIPGHNFGEYGQMQFADMPQITSTAMMQDSYFQSSPTGTDTTMLHPPLPDFDRSADFDVHTPMLTE